MRTLFCVLCLLFWVIFVESSPSRQQHQPTSRARKSYKRPSNVGSHRPGPKPLGSYQKSKPTGGNTPPPQHAELHVFRKRPTSLPPPKAATRSNSAQAAAASAATIPTFFNSSGFFYLVHIAKCAGGSLEVELSDLVAQGRFASSEDCFACARRFGRADHKEAASADCYLTMLRSPRSHVVSQFFMLKKFGGWCALDPPQGGRKSCSSNFPQKSDVEMLYEWLEYYASPT